MAEILVFTKTGLEDHPDPAVAAMTYKPGHIITIQEDGYPWHPEVFESGYHAKVIKIPGATIDEISHLCAAMPDKLAALDEPAYLKQLRIWKFKYKYLPDKIDLEKLEDHFEKVLDIVDGSVL